MILDFLCVLRVESGKNSPSQYLNNKKRPPFQESVFYLFS